MHAPHESCARSRTCLKRRGQRSFRNQRVRVDEHEDVSLGHFGPCVAHRGDVTQFHLKYARPEGSRRFDRGVGAAVGNDNNLTRRTRGLAERYNCSMVAEMKACLRRAVR